MSLSSKIITLNGGGVLPPFAFKSGSKGVPACVLSLASDTDATSLINHEKAVVAEAFGDRPIVPPKTSIVKLGGLKRGGNGVDRWPSSIRTRYYINTCRFLDGTNNNVPIKCDLHRLNRMPWSSAKVKIDKVQWKADKTCIKYIGLELIELVLEPIVPMDGSVGKTVIKINASDIAAYAGLNRYKTQSDIFHDKIIVKHMMSSRDIKRARARCVPVDNVSRVAIRAAKRKIEEIDVDDENDTDEDKEDDDEACRKRLKKTSDKIEVILRAVEKEPTNTTFVQAAVDSGCGSFVQRVQRCEQGTIAEAKDAVKYEDTVPTTTSVTHPTTLFTYVMDEINHDKFTFVLVGKVDGIENETTVIENKRRTYKLFENVRAYEACQLEAYFKLTGLTNAKLIETFQDEQNVISYQHSPVFWERIVTGFQNGCQRYLSDNVKSH
jgi:hypothetical protein